MCLWFPQGRHRAALLPLPPPRRSPSVSRSKSGTPSPSGPGILLSITARFAETISWISVSPFFSSAIFLRFFFFSLCWLWHWVSFVTFQSGEVWIAEYMHTLFI
uniref:Uncharacterized protein n=1 Tax=Rhizophora mucronata TaxID=61149 RepID=A0A2P2KR83_RHIMU